MLAEFIVYTMIGYNLYKDTACVAHISRSVYLTAQLIFICHQSRKLDSLANPVSAFLLSFYSLVLKCVPGWSTHMRFSGASVHARHKNNRRITKLWKQEISILRRQSVTPLETFHWTFEVIPILSTATTTNSDILVYWYYLDSSIHHCHIKGFKYASVISKIETYLL